MEIPYTELSGDALRGVIEEFVSREGTEYGQREYTLEDKINRVVRQLESGEVKLFFDEQSQTCNLVRIT
ncbi:MAG: YheU family protein [Pseudomonadota bacterium]|nr:YheU family protein [Pseudomonadales bacterium]MEE3289629.1 YheU family protein [Pseudomonadota bacterium]